MGPDSQSETFGLISVSSDTSVRDAVGASKSVQNVFRSVSGGQKSGRPRKAGPTRPPMGPLRKVT
jgi:hypothetical protein